MNGLILGLFGEAKYKSDTIIKQVYTWTGGKSVSDQNDDMTLIAVGCVAEQLAGKNTIHS